MKPDLPMCAPWRPGCPGDASRRASGRSAPGACQPAPTVSFGHAGTPGAACRVAGRKGPADVTSGRTRGNVDSGQGCVSRAGARRRPGVQLATVDQRGCTLSLTETITGQVEVCQRLAGAADCQRRRATIDGTSWSAEVPLDGGDPQPGGRRGPVRLARSSGSGAFVSTATASTPSCCLRAPCSRRRRAAPERRSFATISTAVTISPSIPAPSPCRAPCSWTTA